MKAQSVRVECTVAQLPSLMHWRHHSSRNLLYACRNQQATTPQARSQARWMLVLLSLKRNGIRRMWDSCLFIACESNPSTRAQLLNNYISISASGEHKASFKEKCTNKAFQSTCYLWLSTNHSSRNFGSLDETFYRHEGFIFLESIQLLGVPSSRTNVLFL